MEGAEGTVFAGEKFLLKFKFSAKYPFDSPQVGVLEQVTLDISQSEEHNAGMNIK